MFESGHLRHFSGGSNSSFPTTTPLKINVPSSPLFPISASQLSDFNTLGARYARLSAWMEQFWSISEVASEKTGVHKGLLSRIATVKRSFWMLLVGSILTFGLNNAKYSHLNSKFVWFHPYSLFLDSHLFSLKSACLFVQSSIFYIWLVNVKSLGSSMFISRP